MSTTIVDLASKLDWIDYDIPGGTVPVQLVRLRKEPVTRALVVLVRFPAGWQRPAPGAYEAAEEVVFLDGTLKMNDIAYGPGEWAYLPAGYIRHSSTAETEVLAFARFSGPSRWVAGEADGARGAMRDWLGPRAGLRAISPFGEARSIRSGNPDSSWWLDGIGGGPAPLDTELFDLNARRWTFAAQGEQINTILGPVFCRTFAG